MKNKSHFSAHKHPFLITCECFFCIFLTHERGFLFYFYCIYFYFLFYLFIYFSSDNSGNKLYRSADTTAHAFLKMEETHNILSMQHLSHWISFSILQKYKYIYYIFLFLSVHYIYIFPFRDITHTLILCEEQNKNGKKEIKKE